ncbi:hypothetical protein ACP3TM_14120 [Staphylococcus sp. IPLA37010]|uniref:Holin n=1 Tax=Staphylococcus equorum TaxID=246432 RepID=A0AAW7ALP6_9STAP|nr:hypothetical protein [Staphylococcus equorum]MDK9866577.1 hypothetical protein [Staphylococcus equorum]
MKTFIGLIALSATASSIVGIVTQDIFNTLALYTPLAFTSWAITEWFNDRKIKKQLLED